MWNHWPNKAKWGKTQINEIRDGKVNVKIETTEIQKIIRNYCQQPYTNKLVETGRFLDTRNLPKLRHKNRKSDETSKQGWYWISSKEPSNQKKKPNSAWFQYWIQANFYGRTLPFHLKLFKTIKMERSRLHSSNEASITLILKPGKEQQKKMNFPDKYRCKYPQQNSKWFQQRQNVTHPDQWIYPRCNNMVQNIQINKNVKHHTHVTNSMNAKKKSSDKM